MHINVKQTNPVNEISKADSEVKRTSSEPDKIQNNEGKTMSTEELGKFKDNLTRYISGLNEILDLLQKGEYNQLGKLQDLLEEYYNILNSKRFDDLNNILNKIRAFFPLTPKEEFIKLVEKEAISSSELSKTNNWDLNDPANEYLNIFILSCSDISTYMKQNNFIPEKECCFKPAFETYLKSKDTRNTQTVRDELVKLFEAFKSFLRI